MKDVRYIGRADRVEITSEQFQDRDVDSDTIVWEGPGDVKNVKNEVAELLDGDNRFEVGDEISDEEDEELPPMTGTRIGDVPDEEAEESEDMEAPE